MNTSESVDVAVIGAGASGRGSVIPPGTCAQSCGEDFQQGHVSGLHTLFTADFGSNDLAEGGPAIANGVMYASGLMAT